MNLITSKDLTFGKNSFSSKARAVMLMSLLGINRLNKLYASVMPSEGPEFAGILLEKLKVTYTVKSGFLSKMPEKGAAIVVSNHPSGALDGIVLMDLLSKVRPDVKFMGNYLLSRIEPARDYFIEVDPFNPKSGRNISGIRKAREHLSNGGLLVIFPAGEVATYQKGLTRLQDKKWPESVVRFIREASVPVIPVFIENRNSLMFHVAGKISPAFRTALLPHELINKKGRNIRIVTGAPVSPRKFGASGSSEQFSDFLRANLFLLRECLEQNDCEKKPEPEDKNAETLGKAVPDEMLAAEVERLKKDYLLFDHAGYSVLFAPFAKMATVMTEIGRLREMTFRQVGEGTNKEVDIDGYDGHYSHLFIWDNSMRRIAGAYRLGFGSEIMDHYGLKGFYTNSLFKMNDLMAPVMYKTIELGRSFIVGDYQRKPVPLMLLWKGILQVVLDNRNYQYLIGPVTISPEYSDSSKALMMNYIKKHCFDYELARNIKPETGLAGFKKELFPSYGDEIFSLDALDKIVTDIECGKRSLPILLKRYLLLGGSILGFNVDHSFNDALDALLMLNIAKVPEGVITMISRQMELDMSSRMRG